MNRTIADLILEQLAAYGVKYLFGVIGDAIFPLADALARQEKIRFIPATIETTAAFMASFAARLSGNLSVCTGTSGPGAANLANGVGDAFLDGLPLLCITGQVTSDKLGTDYKQYINQTEFFEAITGKSRLCTHPGTVIPILTGLINQALAYQTTVHLEIPQDILGQTTDAQIAPAMQPLVDLGRSKMVYGPLNQVLGMMEQAKNPVIIIGKKACPFAAILKSFAESFGAALVISRECKGTIPDENPLVIGGIGEAYLPRCFPETDLLLLFGEAVYEERFFPPKALIVQFRNSIHPGPGKYLEITGDYDRILREIRNKFPQIIPRDEWRSQIETAHQERIQAATQPGDPRHPLRFFQSLSRVLADDALVTLDVGEFVYWFDLGFLAKNQTVLLSTNWRSMGAGLPAGIAAAIHEPGRRVVSITGDGGFLMSLAELATIQRFHLPLTVFVLRNQCYGLEIQKMTREKMEPFGTDLVLPDLLKLAEAFSFKGFRITSPENSSGIIQEALENAPALVDVEVNPETLPWL